VLILGSLAGSDLMFAEHLLRRGLSCCVARKPSSESHSQPMGHWSEYHTHISSDDISLFSNPSEFVAIARQCRAIVSFTGSYIMAIKYLWPVRRLLSLPPVINVCTGSDIMELAVERSVLGWLYRQHLRTADLNWCFSAPRSLENLVALRVPRIVFLRYPFYLAPKPSPIRSEEGKLRFFHASHLDWKASDQGGHRWSAKGNDRFFRAFARAVRDGLEAECIVLDRGPDRQQARMLARDLGIEGCLSWKPQLSRDELFEEFSRADIVVDQFDVGSHGGITIEAMSLGKPVMVYVNANTSRVVYPDPMPVLNCHTEEEIYSQLMRCRDRNHLFKLGADARTWVEKYHSWETCLDQFLFYFTLLTGKQVVDYAWSHGGA
jgi:glycosyltransferase involved in cell wall biosynthesis